MPKARVSGYIRVAWDTLHTEGKAITKRRTAGPRKKGKKPSLTDPQRAFLACYGEMGVIRQACKVAKVGRQTHYDWMKRDPEYRAAFESAQEDAVDSLEAEVYRRAVTGVVKPVGWYKGVAGGEVREYSDLLLMFSLKALAPEKYREKVEIRGALAHIDLATLPDDLLARIAAGEDPRAVLASATPDQQKLLNPGLTEPS